MTKFQAKDLQSYIFVFHQAARMANYTRFSPADWSGSNMSHYNSADNSRNHSERIRNEAVRLMREREEKTVLTQRDADRRIGERLHDVTFWRSELQVSMAFKDRTRSLKSLGSFYAEAKI